MKTQEWLAMNFQTVLKFKWIVYKDKTFARSYFRTNHHYSFPKMRMIFRMSSKKSVALQECIKWLWSLLANLILIFVGTFSRTLLLTEATQCLRALQSAFKSSCQTFRHKTSR
jgi:hypothetical protein